MQMAEFGCDCFYIYFYWLSPNYQAGERNRLEHSKLEEPLKIIQSLSSLAAHLKKNEAVKNSQIYSYLRSSWYQSQHKAPNRQRNHLIHMHIVKQWL